MNFIRSFGPLPELKHQDFNENYAIYTSIINFLTADEVERVKKIWNNDNSVKQVYGSNAEIPDKTRAEQLFINPDQHSWIYDKVSMACIMVNANRYKFAINGFREKLRILNYLPGNESRWHSDYGAAKKSDRKLVISIQLSERDEYEGGELEILQAVLDEKIIKKGTAIIFPAFAAHRVLPLISGCRKSLVGTIAGPPFR